MTEVEKLKEIREKYNLPRDYVAWRIGAASYTVFRWEKQISTPSPYYKRELRRLFKKFPGGEI